MQDRRATGDTISNGELADGLTLSQACTCVAGEGVTQLDAVQGGPHDASSAAIPSVESTH